MAKKKRKGSFRERIFAWRSSRKSGSRRSVLQSWNWMLTLKVVAVILFLTASGVFLRYAEGYVIGAGPAAEGSLILVGVPNWVDRELQARVAAVAGGGRLPLTDETAAVVTRNLEPMAWLDEVRVQVTHESVRLHARWRKPVARIEIRETSSQIYVDDDLIVLDYMPMAHLPIVEVAGVDLRLVPLPGERFDQKDLAAAVELIELLREVDAEYTPANPLLEHVASIDVSNFMGRRNRGPHIVLHSKDETQIIWGAEIDEWAKYLEATDEEKLGKLYAYYREHGSLSAGVKYINLRDPQDKVPLPIDKYRH